MEFNVKNLVLTFFVSVICFISSTTEAHVLDGAKELNGHYYKIF